MPGVKLGIEAGELQRGANFVYKVVVGEGLSIRVLEEGGGWRAVGVSAPKVLESGDWASRLARGGRDCD